MSLFVAGVVPNLPVEEIMSIWDCDGFDDDQGYVSSCFLILRTIDDLLSREDVSLAEVLKSEDLIQEVNGLNDNLITYLKNPQIAEALIKFG